MSSKRDPYTSPTIPVRRAKNRNVTVRMDTELFGRIVKWIERQHRQGKEVSLSSKTRDLWRVFLEDSE